MHTLKILMKLLAIDFHYKRIHQIYKDKTSMHCVIMLMNRSLQFYHAIEHLNTIFKLLKKRDASNASRINERLLCAIKGFITEHTLIPVSFNFGGDDLLS